jgi:tellurite methyltransferase
VAPNPLLVRFQSLLTEGALEGPVLDLACGRGENGLFLARLGLPVILADRSGEALASARRRAVEAGLSPAFWEIDLETGKNTLESDWYRAIVVFRYLYRPLMDSIRNGVRAGGIVIYETFTIEQSQYGKPHNPDFLLQPGELAHWFRDWQIIHSWEGLLTQPTRAMAQIVCRRPLSSESPSGG